MHVTQESIPHLNTAEKGKVCNNPLHIHVTSVAAILKSCFLAERVNKAFSHQVNDAVPFFKRSE